LISDSAAQVAEIESFVDIPLTVIGSGRPNPAFGEAAEAFQQFWIEQNHELAARSTRGEFILVPQGGHTLYVDAPDAILDAIRRRVQDSREEPRA
jgi:pimeloyl-ACP methyl ester carboxylesterase